MFQTIKTSAAKQVQRRRNGMTIIDLVHLNAAGFARLADVSRDTPGAQRIWPRHEPQEDMMAIAGWVWPSATMNARFDAGWADGLVFAARWLATPRATWPQPRYPVMLVAEQDVLAAGPTVDRIRARCHANGWLGVVSERGVDWQLPDGTRLADNEAARFILSCLQATPAHSGVIEVGADIHAQLQEISCAVTMVGNTSVSTRYLVGPMLIEVRTSPATRDHITLLKDCVPYHEHFSPGMTSESLALYQSLRRGGLEISLAAQSAQLLAA